jgi:hypothetical protein
VKEEEPFIEKVNFSFVASFETSLAQLREIARDMFGTALCQSAVTPFSALIRLQRQRLHFSSCILRVAR